MNRRSRLWLAATVVFTLGNVGGAVYAAAQGEPLHAAVHVALMIVGTYVAWRLAGRTERQEQPTAQLADARLEQLQQAVDAVALEVERIGEAQRFSDKLQSERAEPRR